MTAAGRSEARCVSIGSVLAQLRAEFPDVTISKIRFLESAGLVRPRRTASGYRQFSPADVERLRYILAAQRDHYLPLRVIKEHLDALDRDHLAGVRMFPQHPGEPERVKTAWMSREEVLAAAGISQLALGELEESGLIRPGPGGCYDADAVAVARTTRALAEFGLHARHLRAFQAAADREVGLVAQIIASLSRQGDPDARARAEDTARELAALLLRLHALLVKAGLRRVVDG